MISFKKNKEVNNIVDWKTFPRQEYKVITKYLKNRDLESLNCDELIQLLNDLKIYRDTFPNDNFIGGKNNLSFNKYPKSMLRECIHWLGYSLQTYYGDKFYYLKQDELIINKTNARFCKDLECEKPEEPLNSGEIEFHNIDISGVKGIDRKCGN